MQFSNQNLLHYCPKVNFSFNPNLHAKSIPEITDCKIIIPSLLNYYYHNGAEANPKSIKKTEIVTVTITEVVPLTL